MSLARKVFKVGVVAALALVLGLANLFHVSPAPYFRIPKVFAQVIFDISCTGSFSPVAALQLAKTNGHLVQLGCFDPTTGSMIYMGGNIYGGPSPWIDIQAPPYLAKCDGTTDSTVGIQNALNAAAEFNDASGTPNGGVVNIPINAAAGGCVVSSINMDAMENITIQAGLVNGSQITPGGPILKFTGTCATSCLSMNSAQGIHFRGMQLLFANLSNTGTAILLGHCSPVVGRCFGNDVNYNGWHGVTITGSSTANGTLVSIPFGAYQVFDSHTSFHKAAVFVQGSTGSNTSDEINFDQVTFDGPGTAHIQNASVNWNFTRVQFNTATNGTATCVPILQYTGGYLLESTLNVQNSIFALSGGCTNSVTFFSLPPVSGTQGGATFIGNLLIANITNQKLFNFGNNQSATIQGNVISGFNTVLTVGTNVSLQVSGNEFPTGTITTFISPAFWGGSGMIVDQSGNVMIGNGTQTLEYFSNGQVVNNFAGGCYVAGGATSGNSQLCAPATNGVISTGPTVAGTFVGGIFSAAGAAQAGAVHIVQDTATLAAGTVTVTLTGSAVFTSATSYTCVAKDTTTPANPASCTQTSGTSITITGTGTDVVRFIAMGN